jgi:phage repressor protein C with HTH and peptisase S24 domain
MFMNHKKQTLTKEQIAAGKAFALALQSTGRKPADIARTIKGTPQQVNNWKKRGVPVKFADIISEELQTSPDEISPEYVFINLKEPDKYYESRTIPMPESLYSQIKNYRAYLSAGLGAHNEAAEIKGGLAFRNDWLMKLGKKAGDLCVVHCNGNSMEPTIYHDDALLVDQTSTNPVSGRIYAIKRNDGTESVKRLIQRETTGTWVVRSDHPDKNRYPDEEASQVMMQDLPIIGRVVWRGGAL